MSKFLQTFIDSVAIGSLYALIALGYTMVYGTLKFINFAHATVFMLGAWFSFAIAGWFGYRGSDAEPNLLVALAVVSITMVLCGALGFAVERIAYRPLRRAPRLNVLITAIGVALLLENTAALDKRLPIPATSYQIPIGFGTQPQPMAGLLPDRVLFQLIDVNVRLVDVLVIVLAVALMIGLQVLVYGTKLGSAMRAVSQDSRSAALMGIPVDRIISFTFVVGTMLAAAAGFLYVSKYLSLQQPSSTVWVLLGLKAFVAAVVGGIGNIRGAMVGGILIAFAEQFGAAYLQPDLRDLYVFAILIGILLLKPTGIFPSHSVEKV